LELIIRQKPFRFYRFLAEESWKSIFGSLDRRLIELNSKMKYLLDSAPSDVILQQEDSLLDLLIRSPFPKKVEKRNNLFQLFTKAMLDIWMRQALCSPVPILCKFTDHDLLSPLLSDPYIKDKHREWQNVKQNQSFASFLIKNLEEVEDPSSMLEMALLLTDEPLLRQICQLIGPQNFQLKMKELYNRYPLLNAELLRMEQKILSCSLFSSMPFNRFSNLHILTKV
jgi:hypothetical protein